MEKENEPANDEELKKAKSVLIEMDKLSNALFISRVPKPSKREFKSLAFEQFEGDFGMALKYLIDVYKGMLPLPESEVKDLLENHEARLAALEQKVGTPQAKEEKKVIHLGNGKTMEVRT